MTELGFKETDFGIFPEDWELKKIKDTCQQVRKSFNPNENDDRYYIGLEHINENSLTLNGIGSSLNVKSGKLTFKKGHILFGKLRPYFRKLYRPDFDGICSTDIFVINGKEGFDNGFLFYFFANNLIIDIATLSSEGTRMPRTSWKYLSELKFGFPNLNEQKAISSVLSSLDKKIELNQKMNQTLEEIGQAIFKHWFVHFEFPNEEGKPYKSSGGEMVDSELGEIPKGWRVGTINDLCDSITNGGTPKRKEGNYWNDGAISWYKTGELFDGPLIDSEEHITKEGLNNSSCKLWGPNTILIALYASPTVGRLGILKTNATSNQACSGLVAKNDIGYQYLFYNLLLKRGELNLIAVGSAQQNISQDIVKNTKTIIPPSNLTIEFQKIIEPFFEQETLFLKESYNLSKIRDSLLPKLMSGKIRFPTEAE